MDPDTVLEWINEKREECWDEIADMNPRKEGDRSSIVHCCFELDVLDIVETAVTNAKVDADHVVPVDVEDRALLPNGYKLTVEYQTLQLNSTDGVRASTEPLSWELTRFTDDHKIRAYVMYSEDGTSNWKSGQPTDIHGMVPDEARGYLEANNLL